MPCNDSIIAIIIIVIVVVVVTGSSVARVTLDAPVEHCPRVRSWHRVLWLCVPVRT